MTMTISGAFALVVACSLGPLSAYSESGHRIVGALADKLIEGKAAADTVKTLLGAITLERASTLPDELRGEDNTRGNFKLPQNPELEAQLLAFREANPPSGDETEGKMPPSHHWFHYTDVPIQATSYAATRVGTSKWDIVQMIGYCSRVLAGTERPDNDRKITPAVAVVLLAHYVGDIHQPLHVGAAFLDAQGNLLDPNTHPAAKPDRGGNDINFGATSFHAYWDFDAVESALTYQRRIQNKNSDTLKPRDWAIQLADKEPADWKPDPSLKPEQWPEKWADEILPIALEAHTRLRFLPLEEFDNRNGKPVLNWTAVEKPHHGKSSYAVFASKTVEAELNKAGWRLAALLEASLPSK
ncbi:MAG: S1/P1 nuclease [Verrucomicrobiota bacterium]